MSDAERTEHRARSMGFVFQSFNLIPVFTAVENVELPLLLVGTTAAGGSSRGRDDARPGRPRAIAPTTCPTQLSGGEQQRVTIARALVARARDRLGRRAHRQPRHGDGGPGHGPAAAAERRRRADHRARHPRPVHRRRAGRLVRMRDGRLLSDERRTGAAVAPQVLRLREPAMYPELTLPLVACRRRRSASSCWWSCGSRCSVAWLLRQIARRPTESLLVVLGAVLGTTLLVASLAVGDSLDRSVRQSAYDVLGPIDESVRTAIRPRAPRSPAGWRRSADDPRSTACSPCAATRPRRSVDSRGAGWPSRGCWCGSSTSRPRRGSARRPRPGSTSPTPGRAGSCSTATSPTRSGVGPWRHRSRSRVRPVRCGSPSRAVVPAEGLAGMGIGAASTATRSSPRAP